MLVENQILEVREHLEQAQNPIFLYDNDADGLCSYVLLRKFIGRGKGVAVKSHPDVDEGYAKRVQELNSDYIFVLDRPMLGERFVEEVKKLQLPIVWIDHHETEDNKKYDDKNIFTYNPNNGDVRSSEPVCYWSYKISNRREDLWISLMGCIADHYLPDFSEEFSLQHPEYWGKSIKQPFDGYYRTEIGRLARVIGFALKDSITHVVQFQNFLIKCRNPSEMILGLGSNNSFSRKYRELSEKYSLLISRAKGCLGEKLLFFNYGGDLSISSEISNELSYLYPQKIIVVAFSSGPISNISLRGDNVRSLIDELLPKFENFSGGGHRDAVGARLQTEDLERFKEEIIKRL